MRWGVAFHTCGVDAPPQAPTPKDNTQEPCFVQPKLP